MLHYLRLFSLLFFQLYCFAGYAQFRNIDFDHIGTVDGLSQSNVLCVIQDSRGFMWFGTWDGLDKYDGYTITAYKNDPLNKSTLSNNYINSIAESKNGDLWIGTNGGGVCRFNRNKENFTRFKHDPLNGNSIVNNLVNTVFEDENGMVWIGTSKGFDKFNPVTDSFEHFTSNPADNKSLSDDLIKCIFQDSEHNLWIGTVNGGLNLFDRKSKKFTSFRHNKLDSTSINSNNLYAIFEDSKHNLWIGTNGRGMDLFDKKTGTFRHFMHLEGNANSLPNNIVLTINEDVYNNLWVSTENGGLSVFDYSKGIFTTYVHDDIDKETISNNSVYAIYKDNKSNMWLGNFSGGIDIANRDKLFINHYKHSTNPNSLCHNQVLCITEDRNKNIWIGTDGGGLDLFDPVTSSFKNWKHTKNNPRSIGGNNVLTICEDSKGNIWTGAWEGGMTRFNPQTNSFKQYKSNPEDTATLTNNNVWKIYEDRDKNIWIGTYGGGLDLFNPVEETFTHYRYTAYNKKGISGDNITNIFEDSDGELWLGTEAEGLSVLNRKTGVIRHFLEEEGKNSISNNSINTITEDSKRNLWIGTMNGLDYFNKKENHFITYTTADGLPSNYIYGVLEDEKKQLWISTSKGISCFNPATGAFRNYDITDGLQSNEFKQQAYCKTQSGMMYFGGVNGFNEFMPSSLRKIPFDPPLVFTNFQISNKPVPVETASSSPSPLKNSITESKSITLSYSSAVFSLEFATLNYTASEKKHYAYMLEGFDKEWNEAGKTRTATYTNLNPGTYYFKVRGMNNEGKWSPKITSIEIIITPPYWLTWWFRLAMVCVLAGAITAIYFYRLQSIKAQKKILQQQVQEQTVLLKKSAETESIARQEAENAHHIAEKANKELIIKNRELEQFAYVASHDLQEPLRTTAGFADLLQKQYSGKLDDKADKYLGFISDATQRMKTLIKDLLDFSRIGASVELNRVNCNVMVKEMLADISAAVNEANAIITLSDLPELNGYPTELKLLFQNLVTNAIKFRKKDVQPVIAIKAERKGAFWQFSITDNGIGIDMEYKERIFNIFQRLHTRSEYQGSGIGLSHCKKIVEIHHGKIWLESVPGHGSTFLFTLPVYTKNTGKEPLADKGIL